MLRRDDYLKMLEKRASDFDGGKTGPTYDHDVNSAEVATSEHKSNLNDNRSTLSGMFNNMGEAQKVETRFAKKWFPSEKYDKETSSPLVKVAMETLAGSEAFQAYPAHYKAAAIRGFTEELEKISSAAAGAAIGLGTQALGGLVGHHYGQQQQARGEQYSFGVPQAAGALLLPGGLGYQIGRHMAHHSQPPGAPAAAPAPAPAVKTAFAVTEKGHKFDAEKYERLKGVAVDDSRHLQDYNAVGHVDPETGKNPAKFMDAMRFHGVMHGHPTLAARHAQYAAGKHREGKNAWNPFGGTMTPVPEEVNGTPHRFGKIGPKQ